MKLEMKLPCPKSEAIESYEILLAVCRAEDAYLAVGYKQMRDLLERICRGQMQNESLQMTDLSARISFVSAKVGLSVTEQNRLHTFRLTSNAILNRQQEPNREQLLLSLSVNSWMKIFLWNYIDYFRVRMPPIWLRLLPASGYSGCVSASSMPTNNICM